MHHGFRIGGINFGWVMTTPFNTMSRCPVLSVPSGRAANGVPTGIQIVARFTPTRARLATLGE